MRCFDRKMYFMIEMVHEKHDAKRVSFRNVFVEHRRKLQLGGVNILRWEGIYYE